MDWSLAADFLSIARQGTLAGAATQRGVNHSTMFRRLNQLEEQLEARLFERLPSGYRLTEAGRQLLPFAEQMEQAAFDAQRQLGGADLSLRGEVRLTAPENLVYDFLPALLESFHQRYPEICVTLLVTNADLDLNRREADLALRATRSPPPYLVGRQIANLGWSVFAAPSLLATYPIPASLEDLANLPWVTAEAAMFHLPAFQWVQQHVPAQQVRFRGSTLNTLSRLAMQGLGITVLPDDQGRPELVRVMEFSPGSGSGLWLLTHPDLRAQARVRALMQHLAQELPDALARVRDCCMSAGVTEDRRN